MNSLLTFCLLCAVGCSYAAMKNAIMGFDVLMHSEPKAPRMVLVDEKHDVSVNMLAGPEFTWCVSTYLEEKPGKKFHTIFGYGSKEHNVFNEVLMEIILAEKITQITLRKSGVKIYAVPPFNKWTMITLTWTNVTGTVGLYFDGKLAGKVEGHKKGDTIGGNGIISVGQDQDGWDTGYQAEDGVYGRMTQFNAWDRVLTEKELQLVVDGKMFGNRVDWRTSTWALAGNAILLPTDAPNAALQQPSCKGDEETVATDLSICLRYNGDSCNKETFTLFYYMNSYGTKELALVLNETKSASVVVGIEPRDLPHLTVSPGWQHWCFVWSRATLDVYINGGLYDTLGGFPEGTQMSTNGDLYVQEENSRTRFSAKTADLRVWERAVSKHEVANEYKANAQDDVGPKTNFIGAPRGPADSSPDVRRYWQPRQAVAYVY